MTFDEAVKYLLSLGHETIAIKLGLDNIERLLHALGSPQQNFPAVQIAGTNGKGSVAVMLDAVVRAAHLKAGLYTSPHLVSIRERIRIEGREITEAEFARRATRVREVAERMRDEGALAALPTFFEQVTAIAFLAFSEAKVELAILETGLGGRLDATTAARARFVAITPIALDHQEYLGLTLAAIAYEKAAIIRPGVRAIVAPQGPEALTVILKQCEATGVVPRVDDCASKILGAETEGRFHVTFKTGRAVYENVRLNLRGRHQIVNASTAIMLAEELAANDFTLTRDAIIEGLETAVHRGRLEMIESRPRILLDGAHNDAGARALRDYLDEFIKAPLTIIFGAMRDKDLTEIAAALFPAAEHLILTSINNPRAASTETLARAVPEGFDSSRITRTESLSEAFKIAKGLTPPDGIICVTGSLYLVGEAESLFATEDER